MVLESGQLSIVINSLALLCLLAILMGDYRYQSVYVSSTKLVSLVQGETVTLGHKDDMGTQKNQCFPLDSVVRNLINYTDEALILTLNKAADSSMIRFAS